jgi:hypothetical protein
MNINMFHPKDTKAGIVSRYIRISETHGVKITRIKEWRDVCFLRQCIAHANGFSVEADAPFETDWCDVHWYGYRTEHVEQICGVDKKPLLTKIKKHFRGFKEGQCGDLHANNTGIHKGKNVVVDFSHIRDAYGEPNKGALQEAPYELGELKSLTIAYEAKH